MRNWMAAGPDYSIEASTNLVDWAAVFTTNAPAMPFRWSDTAATSQIAFYRALQRLGLLDNRTV